MLDIHSITFEQSFGRISQMPPSEIPEIAFIGRSNVGKSSMINKVFNRKNLARTSQVPGKTATINFYKLRDARFVDLPGYGYAKTGKDEHKRLGGLIRGYLELDRDVRLICLLIDIRHPPSKLDCEMADYLIDSELPFIVVLTKADKLSKSQREEQKKVITGLLPCGEDLTAVTFSSVTGEGTETLHSIFSDVLSDAD